MKLLGNYGSPFVRRVAITLNLYDLPYELAADVRGNGVIEQFNPLGRVPAFVLDDGECLIDSAAIIDYLDHLVGTERSLTPLSGIERARMVSMLAIAVGATEKAMGILNEVEKRPEEARYPPWAHQLGQQAKAAFEFLDSHYVGPWMFGDKITQLDVTCVAFWNIIEHIMKVLAARVAVPNIRGLIEKTSSIDAFSVTVPGQEALSRAVTRSAAVATLTDFSTLN